MDSPNQRSYTYQYMINAKLLSLLKVCDSIWLSTYRYLFTGDVSLKDLNPQL